LDPRSIGKGEKGEREGNICFRNSFPTKGKGCSAQGEGKGGKKDPRKGREEGTREVAELPSPLRKKGGKGKKGRKTDGVGAARGGGKKKGEEEDREQ